tara:strand:- start:370 stop:669 length:300 start_codon:yes stop_codon:yes gene_type:complete
VDTHANKKQQERGRKMSKQNCYKAFNYTAEELKDVNAGLKQLTQILSEEINDIYPGTRKLLVPIREKDIVRKLIKDKISELLRKKSLSNLHEDARIQGK